MRQAGLFGSLLLGWLAPGCTDFRSSEPQASGSLDIDLVEVATVGLLDGPDEQVLGLIRDVAALPDGSFVVLDGQAPAIRWYRPDGSYIAGVTEVGEGPGELGTPRAMAVTGDGILGLLDSQRQHLATHEMTARGFEYVDSFPVSMSPYDYRDRNLCGATSHWYLQQLDQGSVVRVFDADGNEIQAFQPPELTSRGELGGMVEIADIVMNSGMLLCDASSDLLVSVSLRSDTVRAFDLDGTPLWQTAIPGLIREQYVLGENGQVGPVGTPNGAHVAVSVVDWSDASVLVQYRFWTGARSAPDVTRIDSFELSKESGEVLAERDSLPIIADTSGEYVYVIENLPYPRVRVMRR
jgi:hypothetical protein